MGLLDSGFRVLWVRRLFPKSCTLVWTQWSILQSTETYIYQLSNDTALISQGSDSMSNFYTKLKFLWREVEAYGEVSHCDCLKCTCNINDRINERDDRLKISKFLMGLCGEYRKVRFHILSMDIFTKLRKVYSMITHEESQPLLINKNQVPTTHAFYFAKKNTTKNPLLPSHAGKKDVP